MQVELELEDRKDVVLPSSPVHAICVHQDMGKLIVARKIDPKQNADDILEQFNLFPKTFAVRERVIAPGNGGIESTFFVGDKIVCTHLNGAISISSPHSDKIKTIQISPTPLWSGCAISESRMALVSHSAMLFTLNIDGEGEERLNIGTDQRLFSVASRKETIAIGGSDAIFIIKNNAIVHHLNVPRKERRLPTIVWTVEFPRDNIVASGDSRGAVSFWNVESGALLKEIVSHQADVLSSAVLSDRLFVAGVDPRVTVFNEIGHNKYNPMFYFPAPGPIRDVKALAAFDEQVIAAGDDHEIYISRAKRTMKPLNQQFNKMVSLGGNFAMSRGLNYIDLYTCGEGEEIVEVKRKERVLIKYPPQYFAQIYTPLKTGLIASDISLDGSLVALTTTSFTTVYKIDRKASKPIAQIGEAPTGSAVKFISNTHLIVCNDDFQIYKVDLSTWESNNVLEQTGCGSVACLATSANGRYAAVITTRLQVFLINMDIADSRLIRVDLPVDIAFPNDETLTVLCSTEDRQQKANLFEFSVSGGAASRQMNCSQLFGTDKPAISLETNDEGELLVQSEDHWAVISKDRESFVIRPISQSSERMPCSVHFRNKSRISVCHLSIPTPETAPFKLKKFGTN